MEIANCVKEYRKKKNMTQTELAKKAGISRVFLTNIENQNENPTIAIVQRIANALGESKDTLFFAVAVNDSEQGG